MSVQSRAVFLSYASEDSEAAARIATALRDAGIEVWFDRSELRGGDAWDLNIHQQIQACRLFIAVISGRTESRDEGYFRREWTLAVDRTRDMAAKRAFLLPVAIDDTPERGASVPDKFRQIQWTRLPGGETSSAFVARVIDLLDAPGPGPAARVAQKPNALPESNAARVTPRGARKFWPAVVVAAAVTAASVAYFLLRTPTNQEPASATRVTSLSPPSVVAVPPQAAMPMTPAKSIAVLPFEDLSEKKDQQFLGDGIAEEIIDRLVQVPEMHVPARASSFYFRDKRARVADIARELEVAHLLEGSVQKSGNRLRLSVQLVRAVDGYQIWSEHYDRDLKDVFAVQVLPPK